MFYEAENKGLLIVNEHIFQCSCMKNVSPFLLCVILRLKSTNVATSVSLTSVGFCVNKWQLNIRRFLCEQVTPFILLLYSWLVFKLPHFRKMSLKCRKCRHVLVKHDDGLLTAHGEPVAAVQSSSSCATLQLDAVVYVQEDRLPPWIGSVVDEVCAAHTLI
jgi:hypothetical protein